jgi:glycosyltransferase involved in cell wall biosynthesis
MYEDVTVVIPCLNEELAIGEVISQIRHFLPGAQILVIDNNSSDGTPEIANRLADLVLVEKRKGQGFAAILGFDHARSDVVLMVDGDGTYSISDAPEMVEFIRSGIDMVVSKRLHSDASAYRRGHVLGNRFFSSFQRVVIGTGVEDVFSGYRAFSRSFLASFVIETHGFELEANLNVHSVLIGAKVKNLESVYAARVEGSTSNLNTFRDGLRILMSNLRQFMIWKPGVAFGSLGLLSTVTSLGLFMIPFNEYLNTGKILHIPTLVVASSLGVISLLILFYALLVTRIIEVQKQNLKRDFRYLRIRNS